MGTTLRMACENLFCSTVMFAVQLDASNGVSSETLGVNRGHRCVSFRNCGMIVANGKGLMNKTVSKHF